MIILEELQLQITNWKKQVGDGLSQLGAGNFHCPDHGSFRACSSMVQVCYFFAVEVQLWFHFNRIIRRPLNPTSSGNITNFIKFTGLNIAFTGMFIFKIAASLLMRRSSVEDSYGVLLAVALVSIHKFHLQVCKNKIVGPRICVKANVEIFSLSVYPNFQWPQDYISSIRSNTFICT